MVKLFCAIVGVAGSAFEVDIDEGQKLFLAKTDDGAWLSSLTEDVKKLKKGEKTVFIEALTQEEQELQAEDPLEGVL
ncbi:hypothetical protein C6341_g27514, partial [Phytophthora cactorum]